MVPRFLRPKFVVRAYFNDAMNLHRRAPVRLAGVKVGRVESVRARPEIKEAPAEVVMEISPGYDLHIPDDSIVELETAGVLGGTFVEIDISGTSGAPIGANGVLKARPAVHLTAAQAIEKLGEVTKTSCNCGSQGAAAAGSEKNKAGTSNPSSSH
jgi:phospholipid/cholesterol/gamma-HCH transport system substrate-binding protein